MCKYKGHDFEKADADAFVRAFEDEYQGEYDNEEDFAFQIIKECYDMPEFAKTYFDYAKFARDLFCGDYWMEYGFVFRAAQNINPGGRYRHPYHKSPSNGQK